MTRQQRKFEERRLKKIKVVPTDFKLTAASGLGTVLEIFDASPLAKAFKKCLPERVSHRSAGSYYLGLMVIAGHIHGVDALSDLARIKEDPYLEKLFDDEVAAVRTVGDFLRDFEAEHIEKLNSFLNQMSRSLFLNLQANQPDQHKPKNLIIDMDSTYHEHFGEQIEGLAWNYKHEWSLETQVAFSSLGFCHGLQMRPGNTKSGTDAAGFIEKIFQDSRTQLLRKREGKDFFRADSAYCHQEVIKACMNRGLFFTLTAHDGTTGWKARFAEAGLSWEPWVYSSEAIKKAKSRDEELPKIEVTRFFWEPSWSDEKLMFPIVVKREWQPYANKSENQHTLFAPDTILEQGEWKYYAVVTNFDLSAWSLQGVLEFHQKRGHA